MENSLYDCLRELSRSDTCPMHMPGHKRRADLLNSDLPYALDVTEIYGLDDLHSRIWDTDESGYLHELSGKAARLYGCRYAFPLVGGSTVGILAAIRAVTVKAKASELLMARNCHKSVYHAVELNRLTPTFLYPDEVALGIAGAVTPEAVDGYLNDHPDCRLVVLTSPTYEGVISPIAEIGQVVHDHGAYLVVDAAHGAHLPFMGTPSAFEGADLAVVSLHKTLPALTQTALLLVCSERIEPWRVARELGVFETSSPSYPLMASIEACLDWVADHQTVFEAYTHALCGARRALQGMTCLSLLDVPQGYDIGKIVIRTTKTSLTGTELADRLRRTYGIEVEMAARDYIIAMTSVLDVLPASDGQTPLGRLVSALTELDGFVEAQEEAACQNGCCIPRRACSTVEALTAWDGAVCSLDQAVGRVSACYLWAYPPGVPLIIPGERFDTDVAALLEQYMNMGVDLHCVGGEGAVPERIPVLHE